jgi:hypothetical protein
VDPQNFILSHLQLFVEVVIRREHVKDLLIVNLNKTASYYLSRHVLLEHIMQNSRNDTFFIGFSDILDYSLSCLPIGRRIFSILAIFHHYMSRILEPIHTLKFSLKFVFFLPFQWVLVSMRSKHCERFTRTCLSVTKYCTVKTVIKKRHDWCHYSVKNF